MGKPRRRHSAQFKSKVALEAIKGLKSINEIATEFEIHPGQISQWKKELLGGVDQIFSSRQAKRDEEQQEEMSRLYEEIGRLKVERDWLKKKWESLK